MAAEHARGPADRQGRLAEPVVEALHREGLFGMWVPRHPRRRRTRPGVVAGGIEHVPYGDPSAGWVLMAAALAIGTGAAYLGDEAVRSCSVRTVPVIAGQGTRPGMPRRHDGGFRLSGSWSFASGIKHATHIHTLGLIQGTSEARIFVLPVGQATLIENWDVLGLRATGSIDYTHRQRVRAGGVHPPGGTESPRRGGALYTIGIAGFAVICHSGWACGIGRRLLDELAAKVQAGVGRSGTLAASEASTSSTRRRRAKYRAAARAGATRPGATSSADAGAASADVRQQTLIRLALAHTTWACHEVAQFVYTRGRHRGAARRDDPAAVPRHARRHAAHHVGAAGHPRLPGANWPDWPRGRSGSSSIWSIARCDDEPSHLAPQTQRAAPMGGPLLVTW